MTQAILVGFGGRLASGKDASADHLVAEFGFRKHWMSEPLAEALAVLNPILSIDDDGYRVRYARLVAEVGYTKAKNHPEVRRLLQVLGTEIGRNMLGEDTWVNLAGSKIDHSRYIDHVPVAITGIRFKNELEMIRRRGGHLIWVERPELEGVSAHSSENSVGPADFDATLVNDGTLADLYTKVTTLIAQFQWSDSSRVSYNGRSVVPGEVATSFRGGDWPIYDN